MQTGCHDSAGNQFLLEPSTSTGMANDGSREASAHHLNQPQSHYGECLAPLKKMTKNP